MTARSRDERASGPGLNGFPSTFDRLQLIDHGLVPVQPRLFLDEAVERLEVVDERADEIHRLLINEGRTFTFRPGRISKPADDGSEEKEEVTDLPRPADDPVDERGVAELSLRVHFGDSPPGA